MKLRTYICHPVSGDVQANLVNARAWLAWFVEHTDWAVSLPWMPYVETLAEETHRQRGLDDCKALVEIHDQVVMVGGRISAGMRIEAEHAIANGISMVDLTSFGFQPPDDNSETAQVILGILRVVSSGVK